MGGKRGLEDGYVCLDSVCIFFLMLLFFFFSQSLAHIGHYKLECVLWVVSAALAPTLISRGTPGEKGGTGRLLPAPPSPLVRLKRRGFGLSPAWEEVKGLSTPKPKIHSHL